MLDRLLGDSVAAWLECLWAEWMVQSMGDYLAVLKARMSAEWLAELMVLY